MPMNQIELHRLSELRAILEGFAARQAAAHATPEARQPTLLMAISTRSAATSIKAGAMPLKGM